MIADSIRKYEQLTGETFEQSPDLALKVIGDSFMLWKLAIRNGEPYFWIDQMYGQMKYFVDFIREVCKAADINTIVTATQRNPKAHIRKWKMVLVSEYDFENRHYFLLKGNISNLKG